MCPATSKETDTDHVNVIHMSNVNQMGGSPKRARVEDTEDEHDDAARNLDELIAAADQANKETIDKEFHEEMPIQGRSADGRRWIYGPDSALNTEVPSYDLGIENDEQVQPEARELTIVAHLSVVCSRTTEYSIPG